jgi:hypothetical protein
MGRHVDVALVLLLLGFVGALSEPLDAYYILFDNDVNASFPQGFENFELFIASPQNFTTDVVKRVKQALPKARILMVCSGGYLIVCGT